MTATQLGIVLLDDISELVRLVFQFEYHPAVLNRKRITPVDIPMAFSLGSKSTGRKHVGRLDIIAAPSSPALIVLLLHEI